MVHIIFLFSIATVGLKNGDLFDVETRKREVIHDHNSTFHAGDLIKKKAEIMFLINVVLRGMAMRINLL